MRGGNIQAKTNEGFKCLVTPWNESNWTKSYNPVAVSNYPSTPSKNSTHTNKYSWNQEGGAEYSKVNDGFKCLVTPWNESNWTKNYNPVAVSNYPSTPSKNSTHTNKYSWNQEG